MTTTRPLDNLLKGISFTTALVVALVAIGGFVLSFYAQRDIIRAWNLAPVGLAWIFPIIIDGAIVAFSLSALWAALVQKDRWPYFLLVGLVSLISIGLNAAHAGHILDSWDWRSHWYYVAAAAVPPTLLFLSFEVLLQQLQTCYVMADATEKRKARSASRSKAPKNKLEKLRQLIEADPDATQARLAKDLGVSVKTVQRYLGIVRGVEAISPA